MLSVPRVTMNGGSLIRVTSSPLRQLAGQGNRGPDQQGEQAGHAAVERELGHHHRGQHDHGTDRQVDAGGQDDQRLTDGEGADDRDLLRMNEMLVSV